MMTDILVIMWQHGRLQDAVGFRASAIFTVTVYSTFSNQCPVTHNFEVKNFCQLGSLMY
jgi:hypothetical protein